MRAHRHTLAVLSRTLSSIVLLCASALVVHAQQTAAPAHIAVIDGSASLDREGQAQPASAGLPLLPGDRLRTTTGRVEVLFPDGSALHIDEYSTVDLQSPTLLRLTGGRIMLVVSGVDDPASAMNFQIDTPVASANTEGPGEYRVALFSGPAGVEAELAVVRGSASVRTERGSTTVRAGERSLARDLEAPSFPQAFNSARFDAFDRWSALRRDARRGTAQSSQYLPRDLQMYGGTLDRYGAWQYEAPHGYVWYPAITPGWRPYYNGYWSSNYSYGWTWIGLDPWGWPTHHYGRWGFARSRWFWIPHHQWAPAWVTWGAAPGYVTWCPLGFDNGPVFALSINVGNPWLGWVVVPRGYFGGHHAYVHHYAVAQLPAAAPVVVQATAPVPTPRAVSRPGTAAFVRDQAVPRTPGRDVAVPRGSAPQPEIASPQSSAVTRTAVPREPLARVPRAGVAEAFSAGSNGRPTASVRQPSAGRSPSPELKQPLAPLVDVPRAYRRNFGDVSQRETSGNGTPRPPLIDGPRAVDRSPSPQVPQWYGSSSPWYGSARRAPSTIAPSDPAVTGSVAGQQRRAYPRSPGVAPMAPMQSGQVPFGAAPPAVPPRWGSPSAAPRAPISPTLPLQSAPPPAVMRAPAGVPRGSAPSAPAAMRAPAAVPRGSTPSAPPSAAPAGAAPAQAAPRHAPSSRRPS